GEGVIFLISATETDKRRSFYKTLSKHAELEVIDRLDSSRAGWEEEATEIVRRRAKARKLQFDEEALDLFVLLTGGDTRQIENELEKIDTFLGSSTGILPASRTDSSRCEPVGQVGASPAERSTTGMAAPQVTVDVGRER